MEPSTAGSNRARAAAAGVDLVGEPFAVLESDPLVFTSLLHGLGVGGLELAEVYSIDSDEIDRLEPKALIFCYNDAELQNDELSADDELAVEERPDDVPQGFWFANQVVSDACGTIAVLNTVLNLPDDDPDVELGGELATFRSETREFEPKMKGLAISNSTLLRETHNALARPADRRAALSSLVIQTMADAREAAKPPAKRRKTKSYGDSTTDVFHYIAYLPWRDGHVYELDGYSTAPVRVASCVPGTTWVDAVRPKLHAKMARLGGIRTSMLALVRGSYESASDAMELLKRRKAAIERRMGDGFAAKVDAITRATSGTAFSSPYRPSAQPGETFSKSFGARAMEMQRAVLDLPESELPRAWERCVEDALEVKKRLEDLVERDQKAQADHLKRTHDYQPFICGFIRSLAEEGLLGDFLDNLSEKNDGAANGASKKGAARGRGRGRGKRGRGRG